MKCLIIQGPLYDKSMPYLIEQIKLVPSIISIDDREDPVKIDLIKKYAIDLILNKMPENPGFQHINYVNTAIRSACLRAKQLGYTHGLRYRTDLYSSKIVELFNTFVRESDTNIVGLTWRKQPATVERDGYINPEGYITDHIMYAPIDLLFNYYNILPPDGNMIHCEIFHQNTYFNKNIVLYNDIKYSVCFVLDKLFQNNIDLAFTDHETEQGNLILVYKNHRQFVHVGTTFNPPTTLPKITAIVNIYKRPHTLAEQIKAIKNQTIPPTCIFIWNNGNSLVDLSPYKNDPLFRVFDNSHNFGVWSRFLIASMAPTEFVCIFDDDTIPGCEWFENCFEQMNIKEALYGTIGVLFKYPNQEYDYERRYGWDGPSDESKAVDIVGHSWFFKRKWLKYFFMDEPQVYLRSRNGEDIHFSRTLQKYANIPTYVPPHPPSNTKRWGSARHTALVYGQDGASETGTFHSLHETFQFNIDKGFRIMKHRQNTTSIDDFNYFCKLILDKTPFALIRPADGEFHVLQNNSLTNIDNWTFLSNGSLCNDLKEAIHLASNKSCFIGIPCTCCNKDMAYYYKDTFKINPLYLTFANIFVNNNWKKWVNFLKEKHIPFTLVAPFAKSNDFLVEHFIQIPEFLVNSWDFNGKEYLNIILNQVIKKKNSIFLFSCGPIAKIFIAHAWAIHPFNIYLDIGSSLDLFMKGSTNRSYANDEEPLTQLVCKFTPEFLPF